MSDEIRVQYETLKKLATSFEESGNETNDRLSSLLDKLDTLKLAGGWVGPSAEQFYEMMGDDALPGLKRLINALFETRVTFYEIIDVFENAEREAADLFKSFGQRFLGMLGNNSSGAVPGANDPANYLSNSNKNLERIDSGGNIQTYRLNLNNPNGTSVDELLRQIPNANGRPVLFVSHGWHVSDESALNGYKTMDAWYEVNYGNLPENERPLIVAIDWDSTSKDTDKGLSLVSDLRNYEDIQRDAVTTGNVLGEVMAKYQRENPNSQIGAIAHSMGNVVITNAIQDQPNLHVDGYLAIEGVVNSYEMTPAGSLGDNVNPNHVGFIINTRSGTDLAMKFRPDNDASTNMPIGGVGIGQYHSNIQNISLTELSDIDLLNQNVGHYSYNPAEYSEIRDVTKQFWQKMGITGH
jgi:WXG100 family type VII secretion target